MTSVAVAAEKIKIRGVPLIFIDTCSLLDLVRGRRDEFNSDHATAAAKIIDLVEAKKLILILPEQVTKELSDHLTETKKTGTASIQILNDQILQMHKIMMAFGATHTAPVLPLPASYEALSDAMIERYRSEAIIADTTEAAKSLAGQRVITTTAPAATGKQSFKDCLVLESCYEVLVAARSLGFKAPAYFLSSNVKEYAEVGKKYIHPQLAEEFTKLNLEYTKSFLELKYSPAIKPL